MCVLVCDGSTAMLCVCWCVMGPRLQYVVCVSMCVQGSVSTCGREKCSSGSYICSNSSHGLSYILCNASVFLMFFINRYFLYENEKNRQDALFLAIYSKWNIGIWRSKRWDLGLRLDARN